MRDWVNVYVIQELISADQRSCLKVLTCLFVSLRTSNGHVLI